MISCAKNCFCFQQVKSDDTSTAGIAKFLSELFTCFQNIRSIVRKRQQQLKLIREAERQASADPKESSQEGSKWPPKFAGRAFRMEKTIPAWGNISEWSPGGVQKKFTV